MSRFLIAVIVCIFAYACPLFVYAQENEWRAPVVYVDTPNNSSNLSKELFAQFTANIKGGISSSKRITMIDETTEQALQLEKDRQQEGKAVDANALFNRFTTAGADYVIKAQLTSGSCERIVPEKSTDKIGKFLDSLTGTDPYYKAKITYNIAIVSVKDGKILANRTFEIEGRTLKQEEKEAIAYEKAINNVTVQARSLVNSVVPLNGTILKIESVNKKGDKAKTVIIDLGTQKGLSAGDVAKVYMEVDIAGEKTNREIGSMTIKEVLSPNRSLADVKNGDKEVLSSFKNGVTLIVKAY